MCPCRLPGIYSYRQYAQVKKHMEKEISKNERAEKLLGKRPQGQPIDYPCELGYKCPVCKYELITDGNYDERLQWSEYTTFLYCYTCNKDYPSVLCMPDIDRAIDIYLDCIEASMRLNENATPQE